MLDENQARMEHVGFQDLMARVLMQLREYRRAIPFCERAIQRKTRAAIPPRLPASWRAPRSVTA